MPKAHETIKMFDTVLSTQYMNTDYITKAKNLFIEYRNQGIIISSDFSDSKWQFSDEYSHVGIYFNVNEFAYKSYYESCFNIPCVIFVDYLKTYVIFTMGDLVLTTLRNIVNDVKRILKYDPQEIYALSYEVFLNSPHRVNEFLSLLPETDDPQKIERIMDTLDTIADIQHTDSNVRKRSLASFESYFLFNDIIKDYWELELPENERLFFYPLYLWWMVTGVIPLRPREFILTPRRCLEKKKDGWYLRLCRNRIKGSEKKITYKINGDYFTVQYKIPDRLANEIIKYIEFTKKYESTELNTLFITDTHYQQWNQIKRLNSRYFTYINLNCVMRYFFHEIVEKRYGLRIIYDRQIKQLDDGCINYLYLGDTRHLALINIIAEGGTPVIAMMLAGHDNIEMSAHYYSNITSLIECRTYKQYRKVLKGNVIYEISKKIVSPLNIKDFVIIDDVGRCYSQVFQKNIFSDCKKVLGPQGEIGYCPNCTFYRKAARKDFFKGDDLYKRRIEDDCKQLEKIVQQVRQQNGNSEEILQVMLRLQCSSHTYQQYCEEKLLKNKGGDNG